MWCVWNGGLVCLEGWCKEAWCGVCGSVVWCVWKSGVMCVEGCCGVSKGSVLGVCGRV